MRRLRQVSMFLGSFVAAVLLSVFSAPGGRATPDASTEAGVLAVLNMQSEAWNKGDLDTFLTGYVNSDDITFISAGTEMCGYNALRDRYVAKYGKSRDTMGTLTFSGTKVVPLGRRNALCTGHWHVECGQQPAIGGMFSLVLVRTKDGWRIIHDHTSMTETKS